MQQVQTIGQSTHIPALSHQEALVMAAEEMRRFQALIESLAGDDWTQPTGCTLWTVKDIVAHQAGHICGFISLSRMLGQLSPSALRPYLKKGMGMLDAWNQSEVDRRRHYTPSQLIAEIRDATPASLKGREGLLPAFLRAIPMPAPGLDQARSMDYVFDVIYTRDMWMHRIDICTATGRNMPMDAAHDGRLLALVVRDLAEKSVNGLNGRSAVLDITGAAGGRYQIGRASTPQVTITLDVLTFAALTSGREKAAAILPRVSFSGDADFGRHVVEYCENRVLY